MDSKLKINNRPENPERDSKVEKSFNTTFRFIPRVVHIKIKNSRVPGKAPKPQGHSSSVVAETKVSVKHCVPNASQRQDVTVSKDMLKDMMDSGVQCNNSKSAAKSPKSLTGQKINSSFPVSKPLSSVPPNKENENPDAAGGSETNKTLSTAPPMPVVPTQFSLSGPASGSKTEKGASGVADAESSSSSQESKLSEVIQHLDSKFSKHQIETKMQSVIAAISSRYHPDYQQVDGWHPHMTDFPQNQSQSKPAACNNFNFCSNGSGAVPWKSSTFDGGLCNFQHILRPDGCATSFLADNTGFGGSGIAAGYSGNAGPISRGSRDVLPGTKAMSATISRSIRSCRPACPSNVTLEPEDKNTTLKEITSNCSDSVVPNLCRTSGISLNPQTSGQPSILGPSQPPPSKSPPPLPSEPPPSPPPLPSSPPPLPPSPLSEPQDMDWMELGSPEHENPMYESITSNPETGGQPSTHGCPPPLPSESPPPLPSEPPPPPPLPPLSPPSSEPQEMDWMELESPEHENHMNEGISLNPQTGVHPSTHGCPPSLPSGSPPPPLPSEPPPPLSLPPPSPPLSGPQGHWMELESPEHENRQDLEVSCIDISNVEEDRSAQRNSSQKPHYAENPISLNGIDVAGKDPASLNRTVENSSTTHENYPKRRNIPVFIEPPDYPYSRLSDKQMTIIESNILEAVLEIDENGGKPKFNRLFRRNGRYGVICEDDFSRKWLYAYLGTHKPWPNSNLRIVSKEFTKVVAKAVLPICLGENNEQILRFIGRQNEQLDVSKWEVIQRWESNDFKTCMDLIIDDESAKFLETSSSVDFKFGKGKIITVQKEVDSELRRESKATEFDALEDDIYAELYNENASSQLDKNAEFDFLEHDIYADFYGEKLTCGDYSDDEHDSSQQRSRAKKSRSERSRELDMLPSREKIPKRQWSPKPGGGLSCSQDPYFRREDVFQLSRWSQRSRSPVPPGQDWYSQKYRRRKSRSPSSSRLSVLDSAGEESSMSKLGSKSESLVETSRHWRIRTRFASRSPTPVRPSQNEDLTVHQTFSISFPRILSFQKQGLPEDTEDVFASSIFPKATDGDPFGSDFKYAVSHSSELNLHSPPGLHASRDSSERTNSSYSPGRPQDVAADRRSMEDSQIDIDNQESSVPISYHHFALGPQEVAEDAHNVGEANPSKSDLQSFYRESSSLPTVQRDSGRHETADGHAKDIQPSDSDSQSDPDDLPISVKVRPGQPLQDVATDQFRKLIAAGYSCEKALQIAQAFVSKQLAEEQPPKPQPPPQPRPEPTLPQVAAEKFTKLVAAGFPHAKALQFTQAFVRRQLGQLPPPH